VAGPSIEMLLRRLTSCELRTDISLEKIHEIQKNIQKLQESYITKDTSSLSQYEASNKEEDLIVPQSMTAEERSAADKYINMIMLKSRFTLLIKLSLLLFFGGLFCMFPSPVIGTSILTFFIACVFSILYLIWYTTRMKILHPATLIAGFFGSLAMGIMTLIYHII
jgi:hypothetical protein